MVVVGADVHKHTHTFVAVDAGGRQLADKVVEATSAGHAIALRWVRATFGADVVWVGISTADAHREYPHTIVNTGNCVAVRVCPNPTGTTASGNQKSH